MTDSDNTASIPIDEDTRAHRRDDESSVFADYAAIIRRLRAPDGCPWDRKQTLWSLKDHLVEESFELLAAINDLAAFSGPSRSTHVNDGGPYNEIAEELGDVILVSMLLSDALDREGSIPFRDVLVENGSKLIRRHPHVFSDTSVRDADEVMANWHEIKKQVEGKKTGPSSVSAGLPPLERSFEIQKKAAKLGFDWPDVYPAIEKVREELGEIEQELHPDDDADTSPDYPAVQIPTSEQPQDKSRLEKELGDLLFSVVNVARKLKIDPSVALDRSNREFLRRFSHIESEVKNRGKTVNELSLDVLDSLWEDAKQTDRGV